MQDTFNNPYTAHWSPAKNSAEDKKIHMLTVTFMNLLLHNLMVQLQKKKTLGLVFKEIIKNYKQRQGRDLHWGHSMFYIIIAPSVIFHPELERDSSYLVV